MSTFLLLNGRNDETTMQNKLGILGPTGVVTSLVHRSRDF